MSTDYEPSHEKQLQAQAMHTIFTALGGLHVYGFEGNPAVVMDDLACVRRTQRHMDSDGKRWVYTTNVTVSVSRVELK